MGLNNINSKSTWGQAASDINTNFTTIDSDLKKVKNATTRNKGYFSTSSELISAFPTASKGDIAYVGSSYPYDIWKWNGGSWAKSGSTGGEESVNLGNYYTKVETDEKFTEADAKLSELGSEVQTISHTETINPSAWYAYFPNVTIQKGERFRIKITSDNPITRMILGDSDARIIDTSDISILQSNEWIERNSAATKTGIGVYVSTENGSSANLQIEIQKGLALLEEDVATLEANFDKLSSDYNGYNAERVVRNGAWDPLFTSLPLSKGEKFRMRINTQSTFTRLILGSIDRRIFDSDSKGIPTNDTWINLSSNYDLSSVGIYMVFSDGIAANVKVEIQKGVGALSGEVDETKTEIVEIKNDISLLPNVEEIVAENLGEFRQSAETSVQNGKLLTGLHIKTGEIFRVKVNASSKDWSRVFLYYNEDVAFGNRLWDSDGTDRTNTWVSFEAKADIYSLGLYIVSTGAVFTIELEKQGLINDIAKSDVLWGKKWAVCGDSFTDGATYTLVQEGKYVGKR